MKTLKELIPLLIKEVETGKRSGLCAAAYRTATTQSENLLLRNLIDRARPKWYQRRYYCGGGVYKGGLIAFYWTPYAVEPRVKWLKKQLKKLK